MSSLLGTTLIFLKRLICTCPAGAPFSFETLAGAWGRNFNGAFQAVAKRHGVAFVPDMLAGVALNPRLNQSDGIHPNAAGVGVIARRLAPYVARALPAR